MLPKRYRIFTVTSSTLRRNIRTEAHVGMWEAMDIGVDRRKHDTYTQTRECLQLTLNKMKMVVIIFHPCVQLSMVWAFDYDVVLVCGFNDIVSVCVCVSIRVRPTECGI